MWHSIFMGNDAENYHRITELQSAFMLFLITTGSPVEKAIFSKVKSLTNENETTLYFSPAAADFATSLMGVVACEKPTRDSLKLFAGDALCLDALFPPSN